MLALAKADHKAGNVEGARELLTDALRTVWEGGYLIANENETAEIRRALAELG